MGGRCQAAKATYRDILERRARENAVDFVEGVATALTPIAFFETLMVKSYETLVDSDTRVDVNTGIVAASRLHAVIGPGTTASISPRWWHGFHGAGPDVHEQRAWRVFADRIGIVWTIAAEVTPGKPRRLPRSLS